MPSMKTRHYLGLAALLPNLAVAASEADDAIAACARIAATGNRILCLEDALRKLSPADAAITMPAADAGVLVAGDAEIVPAGSNSSAPDTVKDVGAADVVGATTAATSVASEAGPELSKPQIELGAEQVARQNDEEEDQVRIIASIVEHTVVGTGRLRMTLDNGQVWQQTGDDDDRVARRLRGQTDIAVEMWQSRSGGYRMHLLEVDRTLRVRRIR